jgi:hypothetical protein
MKRALIVVVLSSVAGAGVSYFKRGGGDANANTPASNQGRGGPGGGGFGGPGGPFGAKPSSLRAARVCVRF